MEGRFWVHWRQVYRRRLTFFPSKRERFVANEGADLMGWDIIPFFTDFMSEMSRGKALSCFAFDFALRRGMGGIFCVFGSLPGFKGAWFVGKSAFFFPGGSEIPRWAD